MFFPSLALAQVGRTLPGESRNIVVWVGIAAILVPVLLGIVFFHKFVSLYIQALTSNAQISAAGLLGMAIRGANIGAIVINRIRAVKAGLNISTHVLEVHDLAGGRVTNVVTAMIAAKSARIELDWKTAADADLASRDVLGLVRAGGAVGDKGAGFTPGNMREGGEAVLSASAIAQIRKTRLLVFDFDGVMSDNRVLVMQDGTEGAMCNRSDGLGIGNLRDAAAKGGWDLGMMVLSKEQNPVVGARCAKLKLECKQGIDDKLAELNRVLSERGLTLDQAAYVGNDINDVACMRAVGLAIAVADAYPPVLAVARIVTTKAGGHGAVREVCDWFATARAV